MLHDTLGHFGIETSFVRPGGLDRWRVAIRFEPHLLFGETVGNPGLEVLGILAVAAIAHEAGAPVAGGLHLHHATSSSR